MNTTIDQGSLTCLPNMLAAIATVVTVAEILKNNGFAFETSKNFFPSPDIIHFFPSYKVCLTKNNMCRD